MPLLHNSYHNLPANHLITLSTHAPATTEQITQIIQRLAPRRSGPNIASTDLWRKCADTLAAPMTDANNTRIQTGTITNAWGGATTIPI
eukprot:5713919-Amphidinium_carterae.1